MIFRLIYKHKLALFIFLVMICFESMASDYSIYYDTSNQELKTLEFGIQSIEAALIETGNAILVKDVSEFSGKSKHSIVFEFKPEIGIESYIFTDVENSIYKCNGGRVGLMYAALEVAERIRNGNLNAVAKTRHQPYLEKRGLKMNIPLDARTPSYADFGTGAQANICEVWDFTFWQEQLDAMARNRFNCITLWNLQPFPSLVKVPGYNDAHLNNVMVISKDLDKANNDYDTDATLSYSEDIIDGLKVIKKITIDQKIEFWQKVMKYGYNRGIEFHIYTWNVFTCGAGGANGLPTEYQLEKDPVYRDNWTDFVNNKDGGMHEYDRLKNYYYQAVKAMLKTYPHLGGFGITAGEGFGDDNDMATMVEKEGLLEAYGNGVYDYFTSLPENHKDKARHIFFIHRAHQADEGLVFSHFGNLMKLENVTFDYSTKYANARLHSYSGPGQRKGKYDTKLSDCPQQGKYGGKWWLNLRNDDMFTFRWGDYDFVKTFIESINVNNDGSSLNGEKPPLASIRGFHMGPDGCFMGREFLSKKPISPRQLEHDKSWLRFMLWGRLAYDITTTESIFINEAKHRCNISDTEILLSFMNTWKTASKIIPLVNRTYYRKIDYQFHPEYNIKDKRGAGRLPDYFIKYTDWKNKESAFELDSLAQKVFEALPALRDRNYSHEYQITLDDMVAFAELGSFYADWIRTENISDNSGKEAASHWKNYCQIASKNYTGQVLARLSPVDYHELYKNVLDEIGNPDDLNRLPEVKIVEPVAVSEKYPNPYFPLTLNTPFKVKVNATDSDGLIEYVELFANGIKLGLDNTGKNEFDINLEAGFYLMEARAYDQEGDFGTTYFFIKVCPV